MVKINPQNSDQTKRTPQQTVGPYVTLGLLTHDQAGMRDNDLTSEGGKGEEIIVQGHLFGTDGKPVFNIMIEIWQANSEGVFNHPSEQHLEGYDENFIGFGRDITDEAGHFQFKTFKPGEIYESDQPEFSQSPNILMFIHASGVHYPLYTRVYFEDEDHDDNFLNNIPQDKVDTLIAKKVSDDGPTVYEFDIVLDGDADNIGLETKLDGEEIDNVPDGTGKPVTYVWHFE